MIYCRLRRGDLVRGTSLGMEEGCVWLRLHPDSQNELGLDAQHDAYVPVRNVSVGDLLAHRQGVSGPAREEWLETQPAFQLPGATSSWAGPAGTRTSDRLTRHWHRLVRLRQLGTLRVAHCPASVWHGNWQSFCLALESLSEPDWVCGSPGDGLTDEQAASVVDALGRFHRNFTGHGKIDGATWLPLLPLHGEKLELVQGRFRAAFEENRNEIQEVLSDLSFETCEKLCEGYADIVRQLGRPPLTLLHGGFSVSHLRFTKSVIKPVVAATDWRLVCRGRGAYDFTCFMVSCAPPDMRREMENWLMMSYLSAAGHTGGRKSRIEFEDDVRTSLLALLAMTIALVADRLDSEPEVSSYRVRTQLKWLGQACDDWDAISLLGGSDRVEDVNAIPQKRAAKGKKKPVKRKSTSPSMSAGRGRSPTQNDKSTERTSTKSPAKKCSKSPERKSKPKPKLSNKERRQGKVPSPERQIN